MIRILLAEDHHLVRKGIRSLLEHVDGFEVVAEAEDGHAAVEAAGEHRPDVVVMDINMPRLNGIQATSQLTALGVGAKVVILSMYSDEGLVRQALMAGAVGYVLKRSITDELILAIRAAYRNETFLSPGVSRVLLEALKAEGSSLEPVDPLNLLTKREREVMQLVAEGHTTKGIAVILGVSDKTIEKHRTSLMGKLGVSEIAGVVRMAIKYGLIFIDE
jgi:DNA-binding NarL/FixJ family response regulator